MNFLVGLLIAVALQMPVVPPGAKLAATLAIPCPIPAVANSYSLPDGSFVDTYALLDDTIFGVLVFDKDLKFLAAYVYEDDKVVVFTDTAELDKKHPLCRDAEKAATRKKGI